MSDSGGIFTGAMDFLQELDQGRNETFTELGRQVVNNLFVLLRSVGMHDLENRALDYPTEAIIGTVGELVESFKESLVLQVVDGNFFINRRLVKYDASTFENSLFLHRVLDYLDIDEIVFDEVPTRESLNVFLRAFLRAIRDGDFDEIRAGRFPNLTLRKRGSQVNLAEKQSQANPRDHILQIYASGLLLLRAFVNDLRRGKAPRHSRVKRLCLDLIDVEPRFHNLLLALLHLESFKGNLFSNMLNTGVLAIVFGRRIGLNRKQLVDLGMAAFHHNLGRALSGVLEQGRRERDAKDLTIHGIEIRGNLSQEEMEDLRLNVARSLVRIGGFNESVITRLIVAYETQVHEYQRPRNLYYGEVSAGFLTEVVRMSALYDLLTTHRPGRPAVSPHEAMSAILDDGGRRFDVFLAKLFGNCMGAYPVGTLVELDTSEIGMVVNLPSNPVNFHRPQVKLLIDKTGAALESGPIVDLDDTWRGGGKYMRTIERTLPAEPYGVDVTKFFFG